MIALTDLAKVMKALSDPTRLHIVQMLSTSEMCACDILESFKISQPTLSYHMKNLMENQIVTGRKEGTWMKYAINPVVISEIIRYFQNIDTSEPVEVGCVKCGGLD